jgi:hypothetical protein
MRLIDGDFPDYTKVTRKGMSALLIGAHAALRALWHPMIRWSERC